MKYRKEFESPTPCTAHTYSVAIAGFLHARRDGPAPVSTGPVGRVACLGDVSRVRLICGAIEASIVLRSEISILSAGGC